MAKICLDCGCHMPMNEHQDERHITLEDLVGAAAASGITPAAALANMNDTFNDVATSEYDPGDAFARNMMRPTLIFDMDDTLSFTTLGALQALNGSFDEKYTVAGTVTSPGWRQFLPQQQRDWLAQQYLEPEFYLNMTPNFHAVDTLVYAKQQGFRVLIASERDMSVRDATATFLNTWGIPYDGLHTLGLGNKNTWLMQNFNSQPAILIDDSARHWVVSPTVTVWTPKLPWTPRGAPAGVWVFDSWAQVRAAL